MLVGGGELHERWETLVHAERPLSRRIQAFTGISQAMVDEAPPAEASLPELAELHRGARARRAQRGVRPPRAGAGVRARGARLAGPAGDLHGRAGAAPASARPSAQARAARRVAGHRGRGRRTARSPTPRPARASSARCSRSSPPTRRRSARRWSCCAPRGRRAGAPARPTAAARGAARGAALPDLSGLADSPGVYVARNDAGQVLYVGKSMQVRAPGARALRALLAVRRLDRARGDRRAPPHALRARRAGARGPTRRRAAPAGQRAAEGRPTSWVLAALPAGHRVPGARGRARAGAAGNAVNVGPLRGRAVAVELVRAADLAVRAAPLRAAAAAAASIRRPSGRWGAACRRAWATSTRTSTARGSTRRSRCSRGATRGGRSSRTSTVSWPRPPPRSASSAPRGCAAAASAWRCCCAAPAAASPLTPSRPLLVLADAPDGDAWEAFWLVGGRVADWGPLPEPDEIVERSAAALRCAQAPLRPAEIAQARIASAWVASNEPYALDLAPLPDARARRALPARLRGRQPCAGAGTSVPARAWHRRAPARLRRPRQASAAAAARRWRGGAPRRLHVAAVRRGRGACHPAARRDRGSRERQLDDLGADAAVADLSSAPGSASRRTIARPIGPSRGELDDARQRADLAPVERQRRTRRRPAPTSRRPRRWRLGLPL